MESNMVHDVVEQEASANKFSSNETINYSELR